MADSTNNTATNSHGSQSENNEEFPRVLDAGKHPGRCIHWKDKSTRYLFGYIIEDDFIKKVREKEEYWYYYLVKMQIVRRQSVDWRREFQMKNMRTYGKNIGIDIIGLNDQQGNNVPFICILNNRCDNELLLAQDQQFLDKLEGIFGTNLNAYGGPRWYRFTKATSLWETRPDDMT